jgi:ribonuclease BN (tRNA processing enzyme)
MSELGLLALGVGDAFSARFYSSSVAVEADGTWLLIDCPHPIRKMLREAAGKAGTRVDLDAIEGVVLTHLHADHCSGLEGLGFYCRFTLGRRMRLMAHPRVAARLWDGHLAAGMQFSDQGPTGGGITERKLEDFFEWIPLDENQAVACGPFRVRCRATVHSVPTTALIIDAGQASLGYSADTAFDPGLIDWLSAADLIVHEAGRGHLHTPYERLLELPASMRSKIRLIHYSDDFDVSASEIEPLEQGRHYPIRNLSRQTREPDSTLLSRGR